MSALTQNERDGLDDVFLSIHSNQEKFKKLKEISILIISKKNYFFMNKFINHAKYGLKETGFLHLIDILSKKKKKLSK